MVLLLKGVASMKKSFYYAVSIMLAISFFFVNSVPVFADYDVSLYPVETWQLQAYSYWHDCGFNLVYGAGTNTTLKVPSFRSDSGATNYSYQCRLSGTTYSCAAYNPAGTYMGTYDWTITEAYNITESNYVLRGVEIPWLGGNYVHETSYVNKKRIHLEPNRKYYISFLTDYNLYYYSGNNYSNLGNRWFDGYANKSGVTFTSGIIYSSETYNMYKYTFWLMASEDCNITLNFPGIVADTQIIPIYVGYGNDLSDADAQLIGLEASYETKLNNISSKIDSIITLNNTQTQAAVATNNNLISGNPTSQAAQSALTNSNTTLNNRVDQMNNIETEYNSDLNAALDDIDISTDLVQHTGFTNAALWVSAQFNRLVLGTPFELVMTFSLITGLALVLIGKMRG